MDEPVQVYKITLGVVDLDNMGIESIIQTLEHHWTMPTALDHDTRTVDWSDDHPLNFVATSKETFKEMFK